MTGVLAAICIFCAASVLGDAPEPIRVIVDGQEIGTLSGSGFAYDGNEVRIETTEGVFGCGIDLSGLDPADSGGSRSHSARLKSFQAIQTG